MLRGDRGLPESVSNTLPEVRFGGGLAIARDVRLQRRADLNGKATLPGVPAGTYYLMATGTYNRQAIHWYLKVELKAGANSVTLDQRNATPMN